MKKTISFFLILSILLYASGCYSHRTITKSNLNQFDKISSVVLKNGNQITFNKKGGVFDEANNLIFGTDKNDEFVEIDMEDVNHIVETKLDIDTGTVVYVGAGVLAVVLIVAIIVGFTNEPILVGGR